MTFDVNKFNAELITCTKCGESVRRDKTTIAFKDGIPTRICFECHDKVMEDYRREYNEL